MNHCRSQIDPYRTLHLQTTLYIVVYKWTKKERKSPKANVFLSNLRSICACCFLYFSFSLIDYRLLNVKPGLKLSNWAVLLLVKVQSEPFEFSLKESVSFFVIWCHHLFHFSISQFLKPDGADYSSLQFSLLSEYRCWNQQRFATQKKKAGENNLTVSDENGFTFGMKNNYQSDHVRNITILFMWRKCLYFLWWEYEYKMPLYRHYKSNGKREKIEKSR